METDNFFHKRKARKNQKRATFREEYDKVLIVCEGEKTESYYFKELINHYKISTANVKVDGRCGSSPLCVFEYAEKLCLKESQKGDVYDRVYCVFDKDTHATYDRAMQKIKNKKLFYAANSVPCFEYWLLLHFEKTTKPYTRKGKSSIANEVLKHLKQYIQDYEKGNKHIFKLTIKDIDFAIDNAKHALKQIKQYGTGNPSTHIHKLVEYLKSLKKI